MAGKYIMVMFILGTYSPVVRGCDVACTRKLKLSFECLGFDCALPPRCQTQLPSPFYWGLQKSEREKPHCGILGGMNQHALTQTPCSQQAIAFLTPAQPHCTTSTATKSAPYTCLGITSALALLSQHRTLNPAPASWITPSPAR